MQQDALLELLRSLSKSEKTYFRKRAGAFTGARPPAYMQLFDALEKAPSEIEGRVRDRFARNRSPAYYPTLKKYLYDRLLESLRQYHERQDPASLAYAWKREAELLIQRRLFDAGLQRLRAAQRIGHQLEAYAFLIDTLRLENHTLGLFKLDRGIARKQAISRTIKSLLGYLEQERFYFEQYDQLYIYSRTEPNLRDPKRLQEIRQQLDHPLLSDPQQPHSLRAKQLFYGIHYTYHTLTGAYEKAYHYSVEILEIWQHYPRLRRARSKEYLAQLINHTNRCYQLKKVEEFQQRMLELEELRTAIPTYRQLIDDRLALFALNFHELSGDFSRFEQTRQLADQAIDRHRQAGNLAELRLILYNLTYQLFIQERYAEALEYSVLFEQENQGGDTQSYLQRAHRLLKLLVHFELRHVQLLENTWRNHYLQLERSGQLYPFEALFIEMIREFTRESAAYRPQPDYAKYRRKFQELRKDPLERKNFEYLNVPAWLEARHKKQALREAFFPSDPAW